MRTSAIIISALFGAGALAHPTLHAVHKHLKRDNGWKEIKEWNSNGAHFEEYEWTGDSAPTNPPPAVQSPAPITPPKHESKNKASNNDQPQPQPQPQPKPSPPENNNPPAQPSPSPSPSASPSASPQNTGNTGGNAMLESMNTMRAKWISSLANSPYTWDDTLAANALKTAQVDMGGANEMKHHLYDGSMAQVIAEGSDEESNGMTGFEGAVTMWLCEEPQGSIVCKDPNISGTGHAEIIKSNSYTKIGCAYLDSTTHHDNFKGMHTCDFS